MEELIVDHLTDSQRVLNYAIDPARAGDHCHQCNRWRMTVASLTATVAYLGYWVAQMSPYRADEFADELTEMIADGEPLVEWVAEQLNTRNIQVV